VPSTIGAQPHLDVYGDPLPPGALARLGTVRLRHGGWSSCVVFSRDGKMLISGNEDSRICFWDATSGKPLHTLRLAENPVRALALSPDGKTLAAAGYKDISLWDVATRKPIRTLKAGSTRSLTFSPDGKTLVSGGSDHNSAIRVWDPDTGKERRRMMWHRREVSHLLVAPDNRTLISASWDRKVHLADLATGEELRTISDRDWSSLHAVLLLPDGKSLLLGGSCWRKGAKGTGSLCEIYDLKTGKKVRELEGHDRSVTGAVLAPDGKTLITSDYGGNVRVWDVAAGKELRKWKAEGSVRQLSPDGKTLAGTGRGGFPRLWDVASGKALHEYEGHQGFVESVAFSADGKTLASSSYDESVVRLWDLTKAKQLHVLRGHEGEHVYVRAVCFLPDGSGVISGASDSTLRLCDPATGKELRKFPLRGRQQVLSMRVSADGKLLACHSSGFEGPGHTLTVFEVATGKELVHREEKEEGRYVWNLVGFSPDAKLLVHSDGRDLVLRRLATGKEIRRFQAPDLLELPFVFSPDGRTLAVRSSTQKQEGPRFWHDDYKVRLFEVASGKERLAFASKGWGQPLAFSPDGKTLAVAAGSIIQLREVATGKEQWRSPELDSRIGSLAFSRDGKTLASGLSNGSILIWKVAPTPSK
jgi:WD40 repeat protein